ncbi:hypothetical protein MSG28_013713 [Choristoneura fumiferana]|uniref:Uncharacterized protein n=1 Tax=Choristoneura fumiferana TaxID=7141 RepID=A0ACC0K8F8_CHOFU|nr:hypothetical protein MSG28_013713 [Choristoneura fumiferana]
MEKKDMEWLMKMLDEKLNNQTFLITNSVTKNVMEALDEKMRCITEENNILKSKVSELQLEVKFLKNEKRKNNLIFFGVEEIGKTECELVDCIMEAIIESGTHFQSNEISNIYRIGKRINNKNRPVVVSITSLWKKHIILRNKSKLPQGIYIKEDYSKEVLEIRKQLQMQYRHPNPAGHRGEEDYYPPTNLTKKLQHKSYKKSRQKNDIINVATYNTLSLKTDESLIELILALKNINWAILGLSEVRRLGENIEDHGDFVFYYKGETPGQYGTGFLIKKEFKSYIDEFIGISERIVILNLKLPSKNEKWSIVQVYSPTEKSSKSEIESFYSILTDAIKNHSHNNLIVMGDFNARIGERRDGEEIVLGPYCSGIRTRNGEMLIQLAYENNLKILNSSYKNRENNRWTWIHPDGYHKNEIDYILTNRSHKFQDCRVINNVNFNSNHRMVRAKLQLQQTLKKTDPL